MTLNSNPLFAVHFNNAFFIIFDNSLKQLVDTLCNIKAIHQINLGAHFIEYTSRMRNNHDSVIPSYSIDVSCFIAL